MPCIRCFSIALVGIIHQQAMSYAMYSLLLYRPCWCYSSTSNELCHVFAASLSSLLDDIHNNPLQQKWLSETEDQACFYSSASFYQQDDNCHWTFLTHYLNAC